MFAHGGFRGGHNPNYTFRGNKADIFEGGHRVPYVVQWPAAIGPDQVSDEIICVTDLLATCADVLGVELPENGGEDSVSHLSVLLNKAADTPVREATVHHSFDGSFAIRRGEWKLIFDPGSGGWSYPSPFGDEELLRNMPEVQLYNLDEDIGESMNVYHKHPEVVEELTQLMESYVARGRSTPGAPQSNNGPTSFRSKFDQGSKGDSGIEFK
jgi:arylsulfatase A-like enzyme